MDHFSVVIGDRCNLRGRGESDTLPRCHLLFETFSGLSDLVLRQWAQSGPVRLEGNHGAQEAW